MTPGMNTQAEHDELQELEYCDQCGDEVEIPCRQTINHSGAGYFVFCGPGCKADFIEQVADSIGEDG